MQTNIDITGIVPVDKYWGLDFFTEMQKDDGVMSLAETMGTQEYDDVYGTWDGEFNPSLREKAHGLCQYHPEKIVILSECSHYLSDKQRHHPDYEKPFEIELLCRSCHRKRHKQNNPFENFVLKTKKWR